MHGHFQMLKNMYHKCDGLLFSIQAKCYLHLKFAHILFTQMLKNMYHKCDGLLFVIHAQFNLRLHGHTICNSQMFSTYLNECENEHTTSPSLSDDA